MNRTDAINFSIIISNISPWAYIRGGLYSNGFFVNNSVGLYSRGLIIEGAYTRDFTVFELIYQVNMVDLGSLCSFSKKTKMTSFIKDMNIYLGMLYKAG